MLGLVGENGAGKSTVIKMLSGVLRPDRGEITLNGRPILLRSAADALHHGIASVFQELTLVRSLTVEQQPAADRCAAPSLGQSRPTPRRVHAALQILARHRLDLIPPHAPVGDLPLGRTADAGDRARGGAQAARCCCSTRRRRRSAITKSSGWPALVDAPARRGHYRAVHFASLGRDHHASATASRSCGTANSFGLVGYREPGRGRSHRLDDRPVVRGVVSEQACRSATRSPLRARHLQSAMLHDVSLDLHQGEILGLGGLVGQGQGTLLEALFGGHALRAGSVTIDGRPLAKPDAPRARSPPASPMSRRSARPRDCCSPRGWHQHDARDPASLDRSASDWSNRARGRPDRRCGNHEIPDSRARRGRSRSATSAEATNRRCCWRNGCSPSRGYCCLTT